MKKSKEQKISQLREILKSLEIECTEYKLKDIYFRLIQGRKEVTIDKKLIQEFLKRRPDYFKIRKKRDAKNKKVITITISVNYLQNYFKALGHAEIFDLTRSEALMVIKKIEDYLNNKDNAPYLVHDKIYDMIVDTIKENRKENF